MVSSVLAEAILSQQAPDIVGSFRAGQADAKKRQVRELTGQALKEGGGDALKLLQGLDPEVALSLGQSIRATSAADIADFVRDAGIGQAFLRSNNVQGFVSFAEGRIRRIQQRGGDITQTQEILDLARIDPAAALDQMVAITSVLDRTKGLTAGQQEFDSLVEAAQGDDPVRARAARIKLGTEGRESVRLTPEQERLIAEAKAAGGARGKKEEERGQAFITVGQEAADSTANIRRALTLLKRIETGGFDSASLRIKQVFGIEGADEGELSNRLGIAVLSQLKATFGSAFTEGEGQRLERLSAGFGKSPAANKRILSQGLAMAERAAKRGAKAARSRGEEDTALLIEEALEFVLTDETEDAPVVDDPAVGSTGGITFLGFE